MKYVLIVIGIIAIFVVLSLVAFACGWVGSAADVVTKEIDPHALQAKYEWFKDISAQLDAKNAGIKVQQSIVTSDPEDKVAKAELAAVIMSYNDLAAQYNAQMAKWNWRFCNRGGLPEGATEVLPREYRAYNYGEDMDL